MEQDERDYLMTELERIVKMTAGCKPTMHEPDEKGVTGKTYGVILDNAGSYGELTLQLENNYCPVETFSIATLVALARLAVIEDDNTYTGPIEGQRIESVGRASDALLEIEGWVGVRNRPIVITLTDGTVLYPAGDDKGIYPGVMCGRTPDGEGFLIV